MNEESAPGLLCLPPEVLHDIGEYLSPRELLAVSGVCRYLRTVYNVNSVWRRYSDDGRISRGLDSTASLIEPKFEIPNITESLEPLCEHRLHYAKQSRLLNNLRQGRFVEHQIEFPNSITEYERRLHKRNFTYGKYLFARNYDENYRNDFIRIFNIENNPTLLMTVGLKTHGQDLYASPFQSPPMQVVDDKLVVRRNDWIDIYDIKLPESLDLLYSINFNKSGNQTIDESLVIGKFIFVENLTSNLVHVWDVANGCQCSDIRPDISGPDISLIGYSRNEQLVMISVDIGYRSRYSIPEEDLEEPSNPQVFVYDILAKDFSSFKPILNRQDFKCQDCYGLIDNDHVILMNKRGGLYNIFVFDYKKSSLVQSSKISLNKRYRLEDGEIITGHLVLPSADRIHVIDVKSLQTVWEAPLHMADSGFRVNEMKVLPISYLSNLIVIQKVQRVGTETKLGIEIWDFNIRKRILDIPQVDLLDVALSDTYSKLILFRFETNYMKVLSFW